MSIFVYRKVPLGGNLLTDTLPTAQFRRSRFRIVFFFFFLLFVVLCLVLVRSSPQVTIYSALTSHQLKGYVEFFKDTSFEIQRKVSADFSRRAWFNTSQRYTYDYVETIRPIGSCENLRFLFVVASAVENINQREAVRSTWASEVRTISGRGKTVFLLGSGKNSSFQEKIKLESRKYGDILQYAFDDTYRNATIKSIMMLRWAANCRPTYLVKADDDMMINVLQLRKNIDTLGSMGIPFAAGLGHFEKGPIRDKSSKWYVSKEEYPDDVFPNYLGGSLYVITGNVIGQMFKEVFRTALISMEDVFVTGFLATKLSLPRIGLAGISTSEQVDLCDFHDYIGSHHSTPAKMRSFANILRFTQRNCRNVLFGLFHACRCIPYIKVISM
ncbi:beta-1,3-galactosyltransferase 5-like isoform X1 [Varroa jacobsoni]|uniref:Hexosyltransferase n=1 Tax=Varroa destructor TaxID=109461 RepID=A0A7M7JPW0_VARDE|nr:beta-1,3-galactosyltransferase 5-like [Varroa destructor]XP_022705528.1 beta-1,3-galactosyltransferase 5-like isoform X1 [Varroa jacobsoni]